MTMVKMANIIINEFDVFDFSFRRQQKHLADIGILMVLKDVLHHELGCSVGLETQLLGCSAVRLMALRGFKRAPKSSYRHCHSII
jgi:hypothetical protein